MCQSGNQGLREVSLLGIAHYMLLMLDDQESQHRLCVPTISHDEMYDDFFEMVHSDKGSPPSAKVWERLYIFNCSQVDWDIEPPDLAVEWLMPGEQHSH